MKKFFCICLGLILLLHDTASRVEAGEIGDTSGVNKEVAYGIIFSDREVSRFPKYAYIGLAPPFWTPKTNDIDRLELDLQAIPRNGAETAEFKVLSNLNDYKRQYFGYVADNGYWVLVNGFCSDYWKKTNAWRLQPVIYFDGGVCFFRVKYNVSKRAFEKFEVNGGS